MPLQNRVTPWGDIVAVPQRGLFTGNRGIIHDPATRTLLGRRWSSKAWIICLCAFRGRRRAVMARQSWTELFFLDEATALAAGHRPCFFCRRDDALAFQAAWQRGNALARAAASEIDAALHAERLDRRLKRLHPLPCALAQLPDGAMLQARGDDAVATCYLVLRGQALPWSFDGYRAAAPHDDAALPGAALLTPPSTLRALLAGYRPRLHPSALLRGVTSS
ncbi:MAG TPA: hypothetical protein VGC77_12530 [Rhodopseudomonas sp.]|uniref:hypothetical protein n=1 Tax=Rhodopseudomonas sp. TaxID=1078 RepID=UPI002ED7AE01